MGLGATLGSAAVPHISSSPLVVPPPLSVPEIRAAAPAAVWHNALEEALAEAAMEYRSVIMLVTTRTCPHCHRLKQTVLQDEEILALLRHFTLLEIDADLTPHTASLYGVRGVPAMLFLTSDGRERGRIEGYIAKHDLDRLLRSLLDERVIEEVNRTEADLLALLAGESLTVEQWGDVLAGLGSANVRKAARERLRNEKPFPRERLVSFLSDPRLAARMGALELLEEVAGDDYGFDPWRQPTSQDDELYEPWRRWQVWSRAEPEPDAAIYSALTEEQVDAYLRDLVSGQRMRSLRAMRMLARGGPGIVDLLKTFEVEHPDLPRGLRDLVREVRTTISLSDAGIEDAATAAHRLVFGQQDARLQALRDLAPYAAAVLPLLEEHLHSDEALVRETAIETLLAGASRPAWPLLKEHAAREQNLDVLITLIRGMGRVQTRDAVTTLIPFLQHENEDVVISALQGIQRSKDRTAEKEVTATLYDKRWRVRVAALDAVGALRLVDAADAVELLLADEDPYVRYKAVQTLSAVQKKGAEKSLQDLFLRDDALKGPVVEALCSIEVSLPASFADALDGKEPAVLLSVVDALGKCEVRGLSLAARLASHADSDVACGALRILGRYGLQRAEYRGLLLAALQSSDRARVLAALESMNHSGDFWDTSLRHTFFGGGTMAELTEESGDAGEELDDSMTDLMDAFLGAPDTVSVPAPPEPEPSTAVEDIMDFFMDAVETTPTGSGEEAADSNLPTAGRQDLLQAIRIQFEQGDDPARFEAAMILARSRDSSALTYFRDTLGQRSVRQRTAMAEVLKEWADASALDLLRMLLADTAPQVRKAAVQSLWSNVSRAEWADALFDELKQEKSPLEFTEIFDWRIRQTLSNASSARHLRRHAESLLRARVSDPLTVMALILVDGAWRRGDESLVTPYLSDANPYVRRAAARALARNQPRLLIPHLEALSTDPSEDVRMVVPVGYSRASPWTHLFDANLRARDYLETRSGTLTRSQRIAWMERASALTHDASARVRIEAFFALLSRNDPIDVDRFVQTVQSFSDPSEIGRRISEYLAENYRRLDEAYAPLISYLDQSGLSQDKRESIIGHFAKKRDSEASTDVRETVLRTRTDPTSELDEAAEEPEPAAVAMAPVRVIVFEEPGCPQCEEVKSYLTVLSDMFPELMVEEHVIFHVRGRDLNQRYADRFEVPAEWRMLTPTVFAGGGYLVRDDVTFDRLTDLIVRSMGVPDEDWYIASEPGEAAMPVSADPPAAVQRPFPLRPILWIGGALLVLCVGLWRWRCARS